MKKLDKKLPILITFSGGRTSAFMTKWLLESEEYKDFKKVVVFANTGKEREETLDFVNECDKRWNLNVIWLEAEVYHNERKASKYKIVDYETASRNGEPFEEVIKKYSIPNQEFVHCTRELKINPIHKYMKDNVSKHYYTAMGIRIDETQRINWEKAYKDNYIYPLVTDFRVDKKYIRAFWDNADFDLNLKDYEGNCDLCYKKSERKLLTIIAEKPELLEWWNDMEIKHGKGDYYFFRNNKSAIDLLELSKKPFRKAVDELELSKQQSCLFGDDMDIEGSCFCK